MPTFPPPGHTTSLSPGRCGELGENGGRDCLQSLPNSPRVGKSVDTRSEVWLCPITLAMSTASQRQPVTRGFPAEWGGLACVSMQGPDAALSFADGPCPMDCPTTEEASGEGGPQGHSRRARSPPSGARAALVCRARTAPACTSAPAPWLSAGMTPPSHSPADLEFWASERRREESAQGRGAGPGAGLRAGPGRAWLCPGGGGLEHDLGFRGGSSPLGPFQNRACRAAAAVSGLQTHFWTAQRFAKICISRQHLKIEELPIPATVYF